MQRGKPRSFGALRSRRIACEVGVVPRAHGTALFTRGETQALVYATLGSQDDMQTIAGLDKHYRFINGALWTMEGSIYTQANLWDE